MEDRLWEHSQKMKFSIKDFFSKCEQIRSFLRIWSHLQKKSLMENVIFGAVEWTYSKMLKILNLISNLIFFAKKSTM